VHAQVYAVQDDVRSIQTNGALRSFIAEQPGANGRYRFKGSVGEVRTLTVPWSTFDGCPGVVVSLLRPNGSVLASVDGCDPNFVLGPVTLDTNGLYTIVVDPQGRAEGSTILRLTN